MATPPIAAAFDWFKCIFCQKDIRGEKTSCPADSKRTDIGVGYKTVADSVERYSALGRLPAHLKSCVECWDEGDGMVETFVRHRACWHIKCKQRLVHGTKLDRLLACPDSGTEISEPVTPEDESDGSSSPKQPRLTRSTLNVTNMGPSTDSVCFFCDAGGSDLRQVLTFSVDDKVRRCATILGDSLLLGKLSKGDMIAVEAKYHPPCLLNLYRKAGRHESLSSPGDDLARYDCEGESLALAEIISYMEETKNNEITPSVFKLSELKTMYTTYLSKYMVLPDSKVHSSRLKERLIENLPNLTAVNHGRDVLLTFSDNLGIALQDLRNRVSQDADAVHLMHAAKLLRKEIFSNTYEFNGNLKTSDSSVPPGLLYFISMVMEGAGSAAAVDSVAALSVAQLIVFNTHKRRRSVESDTAQSQPVIRHAAARETSLPVYIGLMLHSATRSSKLVDKCHKLGLSISYDRVLQISNKTANTVCDQYRTDNLVCPPSLKSGCFTVAAVDNIDHNLSSSTAQTSFHGTAISITQFSDHVQDETVFSYSSAASDLASDIVLPTAYTEISPCILPAKDPVIPNVAVDLSQFSVNDDEYVWLNSIAECFLSDNELAEKDLENWSWAAFHANQDQRTCLNYSSSVLLPLFRHSSNTAAMMRHSLLVVQDIVKKVNEGQIPVITADQPLFALIKQIQWHWPHKFGEDQFVVLLGGLHTEMAALRMLGHWLAGSGWVESIVQSAIATAGVAESFITVSHVKRTRYAHTVTAAALYINLQQTYALYADSVTDDEVQSFSEWRAECAKQSVQFMYWSTVLDLELLVLSFVRSLRMGNFLLYVQCLQKLAPWFFICDQTNYARWLPVHIRDMLALQNSHPAVYEQFKLGNFTASKTGSKFSCIALDQVHEQMNTLIKGEGGAVGLTENEGALSRWSVTGPEIVRMLEQFESKFLNLQSSDNKHHEQTHAFQNHFRDDVNKLLGIFTSEIPFSITSGEDLVILCTNTLADKVVAQTVRTAEEIGTKQFETFFQERLSANSNTSLTAPITRNKAPLFQFKANSKKTALSSLRVTELKSDCELFSRLYISCQTRDGNLDDFFCYENQVYPPSLSQGGTLYTGTKSDLLDCLAVDSKHDVADLSCSCCIMDGAVIVQMLRPDNARTFLDYRTKVFVPYLLAVLQKVQRIDVVFDVYLAGSLKLSTREKRGVGTRFQVVSNAKIPSNWHEFLRVDANKTELFHFLAETDLTAFDTHGKTVLFTYDDSVRIAAGSVDTTGVNGCNHEEADTRVILHAYHAACAGSKSVLIRTVDTDIVVLAISFFSQLNVSELWIHFGTGKCARLLPVHEICASLGPEKCSVLPAFHALTGCDTTSAFRGKGKKSAWLTWDSYPDLTKALQNLSVHTAGDGDTLSTLERFVILLYDRSSDLEALNVARKHMFTKKARTLENIPPTSNAFLQHIKRSVYQAVHCWSHSLVSHMPQIDPAEWGWCKDGDKWQPVWMTIPQVSQMCQELLHCSCKKACTARCKCFKANLPCTSLCQCDGECERS